MSLGSVPESRTRRAPDRRGRRRSLSGLGRGEKRTRNRRSGRLATVGRWLSPRRRDCYRLEVATGPSRPGPVRDVRVTEGR